MFGFASEIQHDILISILNFLISFVKHCNKMNKIVFSSLGCIVTY